MKMLLEGQDEFLYKLRIQFESSEILSEKPIVGFLLYIEDGLITTLEGYTLGDELF